MSQLQRYTDAHRFIAQKFLLSGPAYRRDVYRFITEAATATGVQLGNSDQDLVGIFQVINQKMAPLNFRIQRTPNELTGTFCYVLVNSNVKEVVDWKSDYTDKEINLISKIIEAIVTSENRELIRTDFYLLSRQLHVTDIDCDRIVDALRDCGYLTTDFDSEFETFGIGVRITAELYDYMGDNYSRTLAECILCKRFIFNRGYKIECTDCHNSAVYHSGCKKKAEKNKALSCPVCRAAFPLVASSQC